MYFVKESLRQGGVIEALGAGMRAYRRRRNAAPACSNVTESQLARAGAYRNAPCAFPNMAPGELAHPSFAHRHRHALVRPIERA